MAQAGTGASARSLLIVEDDHVDAAVVAGDVVGHVPFDGRLGEERTRLAFDRDFDEG